MTETVNNSFPSKQCDEEEKRGRYERENEREKIERRHETGAEREIKGSSFRASPYDSLNKELSLFSSSGTQCFFLTFPSDLLHLLCFLFESEPESAEVKACSSPHLKRKAVRWGSSDRSGFRRLGT